MIACSSTALNIMQKLGWHVPYFREMSKSTVRAIHSSMLLHNSGKVNNTAVLLPNLKVISLLPHTHFEIFPCGLQLLSLTGSLLLVLTTVTEAPWQQHSQTGSFTTTYLVIQEILDKFNCYKFKYRTSFISDLCLQPSCGHSLLVTLRDN